MRGLTWTRPKMMGPVRWPVNALPMDPVDLASAGAMMALRTILQNHGVLAAESIPLTQHH